MAKPPLITFLYLLIVHLPRRDNFIIHNSFYRIVECYRAEGDAVIPALILKEFPILTCASISGIICFETLSYSITLQSAADLPPSSA